MSYEVDFVEVSTVRLESSPVAAALAGLRANEARYFKNKYDHIFTVESAADAVETVERVRRILEEERGIVVASVPLEATTVPPRTPRPRWPTARCTPRRSAARQHRRRLTQGRRRGSGATLPGACPTADGGGAVSRGVRVGCLPRSFSVGVAACAAAGSAPEGAGGGVGACLHRVPLLPGAWMLTGESGSLRGGQGLSQPGLARTDSDRREDVAVAEGCPSAGA